MAKPVHPAFVHFPIAFLFLAYGMDVMNALRGSLPSSISSNLLVANDMTRATYYLISMGLITALPAVVTGGAEALKMIQKQGMYEADGKTIKNKVKATIAHAIANDIVIAATTFIWYQRRAEAKNSYIPGTGAAAYAPTSWMVIVEGLLLAGLGMASNIGGTLTYNFGVGFSSMSASKESVVPGPKKVK